MYVQILSRFSNGANLIYIVSGIGQKAHTSEAFLFLYFITFMFLLGYRLLEICRQVHGQLLNWFGNHYCWFIVIMVMTLYMSPGVSGVSGCWKLPKRIM